MSDTILENKITETFRKLREDIDSGIIEQIVSLINQGVITILTTPISSRRESPLNPDNYRMTISQCVSVGFTGKEKMEVLEKENAELKSKLDKTVEALRFYADTKNWGDCGDPASGLRILNDWERFDITLGFHRNIGGKRARQALKEIE
jgi:hypothetical protein